MNLPRLFDEKSELVEVDTSTFDPPTLARYNAVVAAYYANDRTDALLGNAVDDVTRALKAVADAENYYNTRWPPQDFHSLWKENFGGGPRNRMTARGL